MPIITPPASTSQYGFYRYYIDLVPYTDLLEGLNQSQEQIYQLLSRLPEHQLTHRYASDKWTIKEVLSHLMDAERMFSYRAFRFARGNFDVISGWDIHEFVLRGQAQQRSIDDLLDEYSIIRKASLHLFRHFTEEMLNAKGPIRDTELSVRALGYAIAGHEIHHQTIIKTRYLDVS